jgi:antitoxin (DNA-binding transcriptional repressor) of toxin-antitoxin stability system
LSLLESEAMTKQVNMHEAKSKLSELGELVWKGERVIIAKAGKPYLDLLPHKETRKERVPGRLAGQIKIAADFDNTPAEIIDAFEGDE